MARFDKLPSEILFEIANFLKPLPHQDADDRYHRQLAYLGRVNRRFHDLFTKTLYQEGAFRATRWAVDSGRLEVLELSLRIAPEETLESINEDHSLKARGSILLRGKSFVSFVNVRTSNEEYEWRAQDIHLGPDGEDFCHEARLLHLAAAHGHNDIVNFLLDNGAEIDAPSHGLCSCLDIHHRVHQIRLRLPWLEGWPAAWHPLHHSMCSGHPSTALLLLERSASLRITSEDDPGPPVFALDSAIAHGHFQIVRRILQRYRQDPTSPDFEYPEDEYTPAHSLALCFDYHAAFDIASQLRDAGFDLNAIRLSSAERLDPNRVANINNIGASPLGLACYFGNFEAAMALLRAGASPITALEEGVICLTVILSAAFPKWAHSGLTVEAWENYRITLMDAMVSAGAPVNPPPGSNYHSPLALATKNGLHNEIKLLLECASIDVDYIQNHRDTTRTALMYAAHHADPRAMLWLLHARANINLCDSDGRSVAYHLFFHQKSLSRFERYHSTTMECLRLLLSRGADFGMLHFDQDRRDEESKSFGETTLGLLMCEISSPRQLPDSGRHGRRVRGQAWKFEYVDTILDKATRHNVSEETWRHAVASLFAPIGSPFRPFENGPGTRLCQKIKNLGERLGYVLDDDEWFLRSICEGINANGISDLDMLRWFSVSDDAALLIPTTNGYLTWETILVAILLDDRPNPEVVGELLKLSNRRLVINGRIPVLHGASLFSLACMPSKPDSLSIIKELLAFSNEWDINAPTCNGLTPLMLLCLRKDESPAVYQLALAGRTRRNDPAVARKIRDTDAAETLLRRGAKAYLKFKGPIAPPPPGSVVDLLEPADGRRRARRGVDAIARSVRHHLEFDSPDGKQHSAYELVCSISLFLYTRNHVLIANVSITRPFSVNAGIWFTSSA
ncbi:hypothetical protein QBC38DRAFT_108099 [Podospora fimiseda]|uniref:Ankyrin n=1 Tax=Podospora fimiseda TaxID=252190 RepID=A0AAN6YMP4_9PEZI|nr:hypothetical protein QBC38DRAFT_108099 [Podospora fimiseda]